MKNLESNLSKNLKKRDNEILEAVDELQERPDKIEQDLYRLID